MKKIKLLSSKYILLTGAGFTYNFGGFLSKTMWSEIHNYLQRNNANNKNKRLLDFIKYEFDYENFYQQVIYGGEYNKKEKSSCINAVLEAYKLLDNKIIDHNQEDKKKDSFPFKELENFISLFAGKSDEKGFFFTLNQDLFIERYIKGKDDKKPFRPGFGIEDTFNDIKGYSLTSDKLKTRPTKVELKRKKQLKTLNYIKLHGSYDLRDKKNNKILIIGTDKSKQIKEEPILSWYIDLFEKVLSQSQMRLLIIGYGFRDKHINKMIVKSVKKYKLKLFIICPMDPEDFLINVLNKNFDINTVCTIWNSITGYYPYTLDKIFLSNYNYLLNNLNKDLFEN